MGWMTVLGPEISDVFREARARIAPFILRNERLRLAVESVRSATNLPPQIVLDGFFSLSQIGTGVRRGAGFADPGGRCAS